MSIFAYSVVSYLNALAVYLPRSGKRELFLSFYCCFRSKEFLFLWVPGKGCVRLLWHSLVILCNYFEQTYK